MSAADQPLPGQLAIVGTGVGDVPPREGALVDEHGHPYVAIVHNKVEIGGWPEKDKDGRFTPAGRVHRVPLAKALTTQWQTDAHVVQYAAPAIDVDTRDGKRLASELRLNKGATIPGGYTVELAIFDVDGPLHDFKAAIKSAKDRIAKGDASAQVMLAELEARTPSVKIDHEKWWLAEKAKLERLYELHNPAAYRTTNGYRLLGRFDHPLVIKNPDDRETWARQYVTWQGYLHLEYGIETDIACAYPECLFRLPFVVRDGKTEANVETFGDPHDAFWCFAAEVDDDDALAEAMRLWPGKFTSSRNSRNGSGAIEYDPEELRERWENLRADEQQRRIDLYVDDLQNGLEPSTNTNSGRATRLVAARSGVIGFGIGDLDLVMDLMLEHWVPRCDQNWSRSDLAHKVEDAAKSTHQEIDFNLPENVERRLEEERATFFAHVVTEPSSAPSSPMHAGDTGRGLSIEEAQARIKKALDEIC